MIATFDHKTIANNLMRKYSYNNKPFCLLFDDGYKDLSMAIKQEHSQVQVFCISDYRFDELQALIKQLVGMDVLLLAEPQFYVKSKLYSLLDFENGEPEIKGCVSHVLIFPTESLYRMFAVDLDEDTRLKEQLISQMKCNNRYLLTTDVGTKLEFTARDWIPLDFEVCTAPIESTIKGKIVVDGAVFFRKNNQEIAEKIVLEIEQGKVKNIEAYDDNGKQLEAQYLNMIANSVKDAENTQLAEIGIGFCHGAAISDCFMEAETAMNTCHFCFGNNICYGGENVSEFHGNSVLIMNPVFTEID